MLLISVGMSLIAPSYIWVQWTIDHPILKSLWSDKEGKFLRWRAMLWFSLPLVLFLGGTFSMAFVGDQWHAYGLWGSLIVSHLTAFIIASVFLRNSWQKLQAL
jgi:Na+-driven multidrug efflux pump